MKCTSIVIRLKRLLKIFKEIIFEVLILVIYRCFKDECKINSDYSVLHIFISCFLQFLFLVTKNSKVKITLSAFPLARFEKQRPMTEHHTQRCCR